jgi:hypothetical protein
MQTMKTLTAVALTAAALVTVVAPSHARPGHGVTVKQFGGGTVATPRSAASSKSVGQPLGWGYGSRRSSWCYWHPYVCYYR